ncbi:MAG TPA: DUF6600 domain-containing protein, partial [Pirellulales bacterium]|nr:DUF6600 domain-containing protein [Pirellulales bacterium]
TPLGQLAQADAVQPIDPPSRVGRLSNISGTVSFHTIDQDQWSPAELNYPVTTGNSFWTEPGARARLEVGRSTLSLDGSTEVDVTTLDDQTFEISVPQGNVNFRLRSIQPGETYDITTPSGTVAITGPGRYHINAGDATNPGTVSVLEGSASLVGQTREVPIRQGQTLRLNTADAAAPQGGGVPAPEPAYAGPAEIDTWAAQVDAQYAPPPDYVSPDMVGAENLGGYGNWDRTPEYGGVWYPQVAADWQPYRYGHMGFVAPWGWTWIDDAPWGFAPSHYGRWHEFGNRWGWIPGPRDEPQVYAPAVVAFIGGGGFGGSIGFGGGEAVGWVPLGPREVYEPPYRTSDDYFRRVNRPEVTNISTTTINNYHNTTIVNKTVNNYSNAGAATVVPAAAMTGSKPIAAAQLNVPPATLQAAQVQRTTNVKPSAATVGAGPVVVKAVGGNANAGPAAPAAKGPPVQAKPIPAALIKPLAPNASGPGISNAPPSKGPGARSLTVPAGAGSGLKPVTPGPSNVIAPGPPIKGRTGPGAPGGNAPGTANQPGGNQPATNTFAPGNKPGGPGKPFTTTTAPGVTAPGPAIKTQSGGANIQGRTKTQGGTTTQGGNPPSKSITTLAPPPKPQNVTPPTKAVNTFTPPPKPQNVTPPTRPVNTVTPPPKPQNVTPPTRAVNTFTPPPKPQNVTPPTRPVNTVTPPPRPQNVAPPKPQNVTSPPKPAPTNTSKQACDPKVQKCQ